ncbi:FtsB family cell division protein [Tessaracoccus antarcticus]|uniref:Septum formation initiator family protein n=1 Tax=Tessaracoccus antarcticus TaxID=2479848 RepID=A0A3M0GD05_9ACTN|nr:septum formation initiator family protein [Tessaracoccus antarcticus]RMB62188.1 septum formation initiator family protein [Tessaracoccus antarcticus]
MGRPASKKKSTGPGRGSPRTRTAARPGERASRDVTSRSVAIDDVDAAQPPEPTPGMRGGRALGVTWRLIILGVVVAAIAVTLAQSLRVYFAQRQEIAQYRSEIQDKRDDIAELEDQIARWKDPDFVRAEARSRLGWVMPGEVGYRVIGADGEPIGGDSAVLAPDEPTGLWWERVWGSVVVADQPVEEEAPATPVPDPSTVPSPTPSPTS